MRRKTATAPDYQQLATDFQVGDIVSVYGLSRDTAGRVVAVWPAIGMVDVQFPVGNLRYPVEELQRYDLMYGTPVPPTHEDVPGGAGTVSVPGGPAAMKTAIYWAEKNRRYRATRPEIDSCDYKCPTHTDVSLKKTSYKRMDGKNVKLLACPTCLFLIKPSDLMGCHLHVVEE